MIDLHTHSDVSDGTLSPSKLVDLAASLGITALALTDHDTVAGIGECARQAASHNMRFIAGFEIAVAFKPGDFHLLGLGLSLQSLAPVENFLKQMRCSRVERNNAIMELMRRDGLSVRPDEIDEPTEGGTTGRLHFARWLIRAGRARDVSDAFDRWLSPGRPYYTAMPRPQLAEAAKVIHSSKGKAVLAHPLSLWVSWGRLNTLLEEWKEMGLDGVEAFHSGASKKDAARLEKLAESKNLIVTGGSDYHGPDRPDRKLGHGAAGMRLEEHFIAPFIDA